MAISSRLYVPKRLGTRMNAGFYELHLTVNCAIGFTYKYFLEGPVCVIGGGLAGLATCFGLMSCVIEGRQGQVGQDVHRFGVIVCVSAVCNS
jgi:hypothetical protein